MAMNGPLASAERFTQVSRRSRSTLAVAESAMEIAYVGTKRPQQSRNFGERLGLLGHDINRQGVTDVRRRVS